MKSKHIKNSLPKAFIALVLLAFCACSDKKESVQNEEQVEQLATPDAAPVSSVKEFYISNKENISLAVVTVDGPSLNINVGGEMLFGDLKGEKRKYYDQQNQLVYSVKHKAGESFKLRDKDEKLLWKVKVAGDKVKIANNEEMTNPYQINVYEEGRVKLKLGEEDRGSIRYEKGAAMMEVNGTYFLRNFTGSHAPGVLMISEMDETEKFVICAELAKLGK
ncbi:hypothetical protein R9C00_07100 [Flammeovirgaceae bacterium SG7u.111]|nr:hypothetical protein [Flammeovirgaceae bacterium SG7u.132]WPO37211.1 hypothetical protein R9C00_07100 [Flammeovirgaceae bacterium SG7u.111]